jgi:peptidoglycan/LPS O-acetylase OafA/YrhL
MRSERIPSLDGLRALSIAIVVVSHRALIYDPKDPRFNAGWAILSNGQIGVSIFFVISGFLITTLLLGEWDRNGRISLGEFYLRRALRILPPYYAFLISILAAAHWGWLSVPRKEWLASALFYWNYAPFAKSWWLGHTWSLAVEEQFYLIWPLILSLSGAKAARRTALWIVLLAPLVRIATYFLLPGFREKLTFFLSTRADALMIGCLLALCASEPWFASVRKHANNTWVPVVCAGFIFVGSPALFSVFHFYYQMTIGYSLEALCIGLLVAWVVRNPSLGAARVLNVGPVVYVGVLSYSIYLWQQPFARDQGVLVTKVPFNLILIAICALLSFYLVERPALRFRKWLQRPKSSDPLLPVTVGPGVVE